MSIAMPGGVLPKSFPYGSPGIVLPAGVIAIGQNYTQDIPGQITAVPGEATAVGVPPDITAWTGVEGEIWVNTADKGTYVYRNGAKHILESDAGLILPVVNKTSTYTLLESDAVCLCTGTFTVTLPTAVGITGKTYYVKNISTGVITLDGDGTETIDGDADQEVREWDTIQVTSDGANWVIL